jgi:hypothetical protein
MQNQLVQLLWAVHTRVYKVVPVHVPGDCLRQSARVFDALANFNVTGIETEFGAVYSVRQI